ncbi:MAG: prephenate dehydrogenase/arogenate dehydrogenase family protein [Deltaproteobacteria bacterium]|nr:prephenate dehydrogenase/arogenate dehydrogenase family protein [Deltaproteobacteria bacterium]
MTAGELRPDQPPDGGGPVTRVSLLGFGRFGRALGTLLLEAGVNLRALDEACDIPPEIRAASLESLVDHAQVLVVAVPVPAFEDALTKVAPLLGPSQLVLDVGSVKVRPEATMRRLLGRRVPWVATHPLFGPVSMARGERPLSVVVCPNDLHPGAERSAETLFARIGCEVVFQSADDHDRIMADTHALAFFVAKGLIDANDAATYPFTPPSFKAMEKTISAVRSDAGHLFFAIQHENPHAAASRRRFLEALQRIDRALAEAPRPASLQFLGLDSDSDSDSGSGSGPGSGSGSGSVSGPVSGAGAGAGAGAGPGSDSGSGSDLDSASGGAEVAGRSQPGAGPFEIAADPAEHTDLLETRTLIDEIDRDLVVLLARRAQLSRRAGWAKAALGREILDPEREHWMRKRRLDWASEVDLEPRFVEAVFRLVLEYSRSLQQHVESP